MAYNASIPTPSQRLKDSQPLILANFAALEPWGLGYGSFLLQGSAPTFSTGVEGMYNLLYTGVTGATNVNELYVHRQTVDAPTDVPFTASSFSNNAMSASISGWSYLPSGLLIKWGVAPVTTNAFINIDVASISGGPAFNRALQVLVSPDNPGGYASFSVGTSGFNSITTGGFKAYGVNSSSQTQLRYLVIGV